jgi:helix-turn-helix protein
MKQCTLDNVIIKKSISIKTSRQGRSKGRGKVLTPQAQFLGKRKNENLKFNIKNYNGQCIIFCLQNL